jgi:hypothetical protein
MISGRVDPIPLMMKQDAMGIGLEEHDNAMHLAATAGPRRLESERQTLETDAERIERQVSVEIELITTIYLFVFTSLKLKNNKKFKENSMKLLQYFIANCATNAIRKYLNGRIILVPMTIIIKKYVILMSCVACS